MMPSTSGVTTTEESGWAAPVACTDSENSPRKTGMVWICGASAAWLAWLVTTPQAMAATRTMPPTTPAAMIFLRRRALRWRMSDS